LLEYRSDKIFRTLAGNRLDVAAVTFIIISGAAPLTAISGVATLSFATSGGVGMPIAYLAVGAILMVFAVGYVAMSRHVANAGALYTYVARGLGRVTGTSASFVAVLGYAVLPLSLYGGVGAVFAGFVQARFGWNVPWWLIAGVVWIIVTALGVLRVDFNSRVLAVLLVTETLVILLFDLVFLGNPADGSVSFTALSPGQLFAPGVGTLLVTAFLGFLGFEGSAVYAEEARDPKRTIARATYIAVAGVAILYSLSTWALTVVVGPDNIAAAAGKDQTELMFNIGGNYLGAAFIDIGHVLFITSLFAALISFHNTASRYLFALGRERVLPAKLGQTSGRTGSPYYGSLAISALSLFAIVFFAATGLDPVLDMFYILAQYGALGVLILLALTSFSIIAYFRRNPSGETTWRRLVAPAIGGVFLAVVLILVLDQYGSLLGLPPGSFLNWFLPVSFAIVAGIGALWGLYLKSSKPDVFRNIGLGAQSVVEPMDGAAPAQSYPGSTMAPLRFEPPTQSSYPSFPRMAPLPTNPPRPAAPAPLMLQPEQNAPQGRSKVFAAQRNYSPEPIAHLMAAAYFNDEVVQWLIPEIQDQGSVCLGYFRVIVQQALATGHVDVLDDYAGAAIWYPVSGYRQVFTPPGQSPQINTLSANLAWRIDLLHHATSQARPADSYSFLAFAGVWPSSQRRGLGTQLISHRLQQLDAGGSAAYLEATSEKSMGLYHRLGFRSSGRPITLPNGPSIYPMWRPAHSPANISPASSTL
jgi:amino acid transporter/ribosomal protein S18 acetylase RimI-like enzyme